MRALKITCGIIAASNAIAAPSALKAADSKKSEGSKKNVLMVVVDDMGAYDWSFAGSRFYETPNMDRLANQSVVFNQGYVSYPRSVPSRYSLFTGMHCARPQAGKGEEADDRKVTRNTYCIAEPFKDGGYETFFIGKWHLATNNSMPQDKGFDINIGGGKAGATASYFYPFNEVRKGKHKADKGIVGMDDAAPNEYLTDYMSRKVVDFIKKDHDKPFFAVCSFYAVHTPLEAKPELLAKYEKKKAAMGLNDEGYSPEEAGVRKNEQNNPIYAAMIQSVDDALGEIIKTLKSKGLYENTIIVVMGDNGGLSNRGEGNNRELATTNTPLRAGKGHLYEGGIRVPFFIHLPKQEKLVASDAVVASYDLFPTLTEMCGVTVSETATLDGMSLTPLLKGGTTKEFAKRKMFWHKASERPESTGDYVSSAVRLGDYKLIEFYKQGRVELYNLKSDPSETRNIADKNPKVAKELLADISTWRKELGVIMADDVTKEPRKAKGEGKGKGKGKEGKNKKKVSDESADE